MADVASETTIKAPKAEIIYRHALVIRLTHWINVVCLTVLLMSGFQIFDAHRYLHWGKFGADADPHLLALPQGFPHWATIPSWQDLATGRTWHFAFAWLFVIIHLVAILAAGPINEIGSMITGRYAIEPEIEPEEEKP